MGEEAHRRAVFRGHVGDGGAVHDRQRRGAGTEELDELADDLGLAQQLRDGEREVGGGDAFAEGAGEVDAHDIRREEIHRLAEHARLGLDAADAPADDADAVDHRGVRIGSDQRVGIVDAALVEHALGEVLEVDLVDDTDAGRHDLEGVERLHAPLEELIALAVAGELEVEVLGQRVGVPGEINLDRVVDHEVDGHERLDDLRVLAELGDGGAHRGEVDEQGDAGEILEHDARDDERDLGGALLVGLPVGEFLDVGLLHLQAVAVPQHRFEHQADGHRQLGDRPDAGLLQSGQGVESSGLAVAEVEGLQGAEKVVRRAHGFVEGAGISSKMRDEP